MPLVELDELDPSAVDVVYRRTNGDRLEDGTGRKLGRAWREGRIGLVNAFGIGVGDDKLVHAYVEDMVRYYLGEEPLRARPCAPTTSAARRCSRRRSTGSPSW